jgi:hypothetical protein
MKYTYEVTTLEGTTLMHHVLRVEGETKTMIASFLDRTAADRYAEACANPGLVLPGWTCVCGVFNGAGKEVLVSCRSCGVVP